MLAPVGIPKTQEITRPATKQRIDRVADKKITERKVLHTVIAVMGENIIRLDISRVPISLMPRTTTTAVKIATAEFKMFILVPLARAKPSSNVIAKIRG